MALVQTPTGTVVLWPIPSGLHRQAYLSWISDELSAKVSVTRVAANEWSRAVVGRRSVVLVVRRGRRDKQKLETNLARSSRRGRPSRPGHCSLGSSHLIASTTSVCPLLHAFSTSPEVIQTHCQCNPMFYRAWQRYTKAACL
jgi:hypothetical protein